MFSCLCAHLRPLSYTHTQLIFDLEREKDSVGLKAVEARSKAADALEECKSKEIKISEKQQKIVEMDNRLKQQLVRTCIQSSHTIKFRYRNLTFLVMDG